jgi:hypothetical protein
MIHGSILTAHERSPLRANIKTVRPGIFGDQNMTESANESLPLKDSLEAAQQELWRWAGVQVVPWGELQTDDYDFRTWARNGSDKLLEVGCFYEFARESHQFRCLIVLRTKPKPKGLRGTGPWMKVKGNILDFENLWASGLEKWLDNFTNDLISNKSFAELLRTRRAEVEESLSNLPSYSTLPKAIEVARGPVTYPGLQIIELQFFWSRYTDADMVKELKRLVKKLRPAEWVGPQRRGRGKIISVIALLDGLSALRLSSHYPKTLPPDVIRTKRRRDRRRPDTAIELFDGVRLGKLGGRLTHSDLAEYAGRARREFARWFPFGETPANGITWAMRQRGKH